MSWVKIKEHIKRLGKILTFNDFEGKSKPIWKHPHYSLISLFIHSFKYILNTRYRDFARLRRYRRKHGSLPQPQQRVEVKLTSNQTNIISCVKCPGRRIIEPHLSVRGERGSNLVLPFSERASHGLCISWNRKETSRWMGRWVVFQAEEHFRKWELHEQIQEASGDEYYSRN